MAEKNWTGSANKAADIVEEDDPFAALARLGEIDARNGSSLRQSADRLGDSPALDLEAELLKEFERYDGGSAESTQPAEPADSPAIEVAASDDAGSVAEPEQVDLDIDDDLDDLDAFVAEDFASLEDELEAAMSEELISMAVEVDDDLGEAEPAFAGPVPDLDFLTEDEPAEEEPETPAVSDIAESESAAWDDEPVFAGPVPDFDEADFDTPEVDFSGPTPDLDFAVDFSSAPSGDSIFDDIPAEEGDVSADDMMAGELEMSLGVPEIEPPADSEPTSAFSEWKNERLTLNSSTQDDSWAPEPVLGHPGVEVDVDGAAPDEPRQVEDYGLQSAAADEADPFGSEVFAAEPTEPAKFTDPLQELQAIMAGTRKPNANEDALPDSDPDIDFSTLEEDLASIELDELEGMRTSAELPDELPQSEEPVLAFDPSQISDVDHDAEFISNIDIPSLPVEEKEPSRAPQEDYGFDFDAEMSDLFSEQSGSKQHEAELPTEEVEAAAEELAEQAWQPPVEEVNDDDDSDLIAGFHDFEDYQNVPPPVARNRRGGRLMAAGAIVAVLAIIGGAYAWINSDTGPELAFSSSGDEPPIILADASSFKEEPEVKGGEVVPNQDKAVYDRVEGNSDGTVTQQNLITSEEEPVDVAQTTAGENLLPLEGGNEPQMENGIPQDDRLLPDTAETETAAEETPAPAVAPRKVKTMIVMPDGTLVAREAPEPTAVPEVELQASAEDSGAAPEAEPLAPVKLEPAPTEENATENAIKTVANVEVNSASDAPVVTGTPTPGLPVPEPRPTDQPVNVVSTVTDQGNVAESEAPAPRETAAIAAEQTPAPAAAAAPQTQQTEVAPGTYLVQIASLTSQESAEKTYANLAQRFSSVIGGRGVNIQRADIEGRGTYYRVRIPAGTRAEAIALCERYKAAGGSCLVSR